MEKIIGQKYPAREFERGDIHYCMRPEWTYVVTKKTNDELLTLVWKYNKPLTETDGHWLLGADVLLTYLGHVELDENNNVIEAQKTKFKVGDWVCDESENWVAQIKDIKEKWYFTRGQTPAGLNQFLIGGSREENCRLATPEEILAQQKIDAAANMGTSITVENNPGSPNYVPENKIIKKGQAVYINPETMPRISYDLDDRPPFNPVINNLINASSVSIKLKFDKPYIKTNDEPFECFRCDAPGVACMNCENRREAVK